MATNQPEHSELKFGKKIPFSQDKKIIFKHFQKYKNTFFDIFKSTKTHFLLFQKWGKIHFCIENNVFTTKNAIFGLKKMIGFLD